MNFIIPLVIYPFDVMISLGQSDKKLKKCLKAKGAKWDDGFKLPNTVSGRCLINKHNQTVIRLRKIPSTPEEFGVLQHELFHAVTFIMERIGGKLEIEVSDEPYAYLIGYLTKEIYQELSEDAKKHRMRTSFI